MQTIPERLSSFIESTKMSKNQFASKIGTSSALISKLTKQDIDFRIEILNKISAHYPELNLNWLLTGVGEMLSGTTNNYDIKGKLQDVDRSSEDSYLYGKKHKGSPTRYANDRQLTDKQIEFELGMAIDRLKSVYTDSKKLVESLHILGAPSFLLEKFKKMPEFEDYKKIIDDEFIEVHQHLNSREKKLRMINVLYTDEIDHRLDMLSQVINYIYIYCDLIRDTIRTAKNTPKT